MRDSEPVTVHLEVRGPARKYGSERAGVEHIRYYLLGGEKQ